MSLRQIWDRPDARFLIVFLTILGSSFTIIALNPVNDAKSSFLTPPMSPEHRALLSESSASLRR